MVPALSRSASSIVKPTESDAVRHGVSPTAQGLGAQAAMVLLPALAWLWGKRRRLPS